MAAPISLRRRLQRKLPRLAKAGRQWMRVLASGGLPRTRVVFVVGSQRSGTRLPLEVMDSASEIATYSEGAAPYFFSVLLEPLDRIEQLLESSPSPVVALKPICETHRVNELLARFPGSKAVWIFRHHQAAVNSASVKWTSGREAVRRLAVGDLTAAGWRAGGLSAERLDLVKRLYRDDMSLHEANAVMWFLRNALFFDLGADLNPDVLLVRYEDLVSTPQEAFARLFDFVGTPLPSGFTRAVHSPRTRKPSFPEISPQVRDLCEELESRMISCYREQVRVGSTPGGSKDADRVIGIPSGSSAS